MHGGVQLDYGIASLWKDVLNLSTSVPSKILWSCLKKLNAIGRNNKLSLLWIPVHTDKIGNEKADELPHIFPVPFCEIGRQTFKYELHTEEAHKRSLARFFRNEAIKTGDRRFYFKTS